MLLALTECQMDQRYIVIIKNIYIRGHVKIHDNTQEFCNESGGRIKVPKAVYDFSGIYVQKDGIWKNGY